MGATNEEPRCAPAGALSARDFGRRFPGGPHGLARQGRAEPLAGGDRPAQGRVGRRVSAVAKARSVGAPLCLRLGRWRLSAGADGAAGRMHAGADWRHARRQEGVDRFPDRHAGERTELEGIARRFEGARLVDRTGSRRRRWRARLPESSRRDLPFDASPTLWLHKTLNVLDKFPKSMQPNAHKDLREIWLAPDRATAETAIAPFAERTKIRQGRRMPDQGSRNTADVL